MSQEERVRGLQVCLRRTEGSLGMVGVLPAHRVSFAVPRRASSDRPLYAKGSRAFTERTLSKAGSEHRVGIKAPAYGTPFSGSALLPCLQGYRQCGATWGLWGLGVYPRPWIDEGPVTNVRKVQKPEWGLLLAKAAHSSLVLRAPGSKCRPRALGSPWLGVP